MKIEFFIAVFYLALGFTACQSESNLSLQPDVSDTITDYDLLYDGYDVSFNVSEDDVLDYISFKTLLLERNLIVTDIAPINDTENNPLLYIINYENGWDLLAADKRATIPLGSSPEGSLCLDDNESPIVSWVMSLAEDVKHAQLLTTPATENAAYNINSWLAITADPVLFRKEQTRWEIPDTFPYTGHYEMTEVHQYDFVYDSVPHLTTTHWSQRFNNCNAYVPRRTDDTTSHAPAGCVAVAGAQMLYYLHDKIGAPETAPTAAYCNSFVNDPVLLMAQYNYSDTAWSQMTAAGGPVAGMLIAAVAQKSKTTFTNSGSSSSLLKLKNFCYPDFGVSSTYSTYNESMLKNSLLNEMPVLIGSPGSTDTTGHAFIIDGYQRYCTHTVYVYTWVWDNYDPNEPYPKVPVQTIEFNSPAAISRVYMNWGWNGWYNESSFALSGDWIVDGDNYANNRKMMYNFCVAEE